MDLNTINEIFQNPTFTNHSTYIKFLEMTGKNKPETIKKYLKEIKILQTYSSTFTLYIIDERTEDIIKDIQSNIDNLEESYSDYMHELNNTEHINQNNQITPLKTHKQKLIKKQNNLIRALLETIRTIPLTEDIFSLIKYTNKVFPYYLKLQTTLLTLKDNIEKILNNDINYELEEALEKLIKLEENAIAINLDLELDKEEELSILKTKEIISNFYKNKKILCKT